MTRLATLGEKGTGRLRLDKNETIFEIWVRRESGADPMFELRFETFSGRGLFRTQQRSGLTSTPAGNKGESGRLDLDELIQTHFVHVGDTRSQLTFVDDASTRLSRLPEGIWLPVIINDQGHLDIRGDDSSGQKIGLTTTPQEHSAPTPVIGERKSASDYIFELEADLTKAHDRISALKRRIEDLEDQVVQLGGELSPIVLETRHQSIETTG